jgi:nitric oxide reductase NorD protein
MSSDHHHHHAPQPAARRPDFEARQHALTLYYRALSGRVAEITPYDDDVDLWQHPDTATTVRLPSRPPTSDHGSFSGADWYQVAMTHRALHHALGTFSLDLQRSEPFFAKLRPDEPDPYPMPPLERFARLFGRTALAVEVFAVCEDMRIDAAAERLYAGLAPVYREVRLAALHERPELSMLPPRSAVAEVVVQLSLGARSVMAPGALREPIAAVTAVTRVLTDPRATVETAAEAAIRVYDVLSALPNVGGHRAVRAIRFDDLDADVDVDVDDPRFGRFGEELRGEGDEKFDVRFIPVRYRDTPGPRYAGQQSSGMPLQEAILRMTPDLDAAPAGDDEPGFTDKSLAAERGDVDVTATEPTTPPEPLPHDHGPDLDDHSQPTEGRLRPTGRDEFVYPEWDGVARRYLEDWCLVRLRRPKPVRSDRTHRRAMARYGQLLPGLVAQLERVRPAGRDLMLRMPHGDDLDLDGCIEAMVDLRVGLQPSDRVFASFAERKRDVAVAFTIDLSSSTAERLPPDPEAPTDVHRILDLQRDAVTLLGEALDRVGDRYGIYGFSGGGRSDVRLSVVKDLDERRSPAIRHRMEGLVPDHTTRMGPAIRHLTARLERTDAVTKLLLIISDGRPYDLDYGQQYGEDAILDYALADTARALAEARLRGVRPYLITVDPGGGDYLSRMCDPREYHVISDARDLPRSLAELYAVARGNSQPAMAGGRR